MQTAKPLSRAAAARARPVRYIVIRRGIRRWLMERYGVAAITMPWHRVYVLERFAGRHDILLHELVHIEQMERDGPLTFSLRYLWWLATRGYWDNPYEIEAYAEAPIEPDEPNT